MNGEPRPGPTEPWIPRSTVVGRSVTTSAIPWNSNAGRCGGWGLSNATRWCLQSWAAG